MPHSIIVHNTLFITKHLQYNYAYIKIKLIFYKNTYDKIQAIHPPLILSGGTLALLFVEKNYNKLLKQCLDANTKNIDNPTELRLNNLDKLQEK